MDKYRPYPSIIAIFTSDSQHPPRSRHAVYLGVVSITDMHIMHKISRFTSVYVAEQLALMAHKFIQ